MDMTSTMYKLVDKEGFVIAEGSAKNMQKLRKQNTNSKVWVSTSLKIGDNVNKPIDPFLIFAKNIIEDPIKKKFIDNL
jgi:hypothetical protein